MLSQHCRAIVWSWWRTHSCHFKKLSPLKRLYKLLGKEQTHLHIRQEEVRLLYEQSADTDLLHPWQTQQGCLLIPATIIAAALQAAEVATATNLHRCPLALTIQTQSSELEGKKSSGIDSKLCAPRAPSIMVHCCNIMAKNVVLPLSMMKPCLLPETFGSRTLLSMIEIGKTRFRLTDGVSCRGLLVFLIPPHCLEQDYDRTSPPY